MTSVDRTFELAAARQLAADHDNANVFGLETVLLGPTALDSLPATVAPLMGPGPVVILEDKVPMLIDNQDLKKLAADLLAPLGPTRRVLLGPGDGALYADDDTIATASAAAAGATCVVSVGSGTLTDVAKEVARLNGVPLVAVQTAASVNGYADDLAVLLKDGVKRTSRSVWPTALLIDTRVLAQAPQPLTRSGFAEMMAMFTAPADWRLAMSVGQDPSFSQPIIDLFRPRGDDLLRVAPEVGEGQPQALELLADLLTQTGIAMGAIGATAPLSGTEHLISHLIDMSARGDGRRVGLHGAQVGVAAVIAACVWEKMLQDLDPERLTHQPPPSAGEAETTVTEAFITLDPTRGMGRECWADYRQKLGAWTTEDRAHLAEAWPTLKTELAGMVSSPQRISTRLCLPIVPGGRWLPVT
jgi:glycerol-1-phosphate dehydrogenase [NAD(P)+]